MRRSSNLPLFIQEREGGGRGWGVLLDSISGMGGLCGGCVASGDSERDIYLIVGVVQ